MGTRIASLFDFVGETSWRFGLALTVVSIVQLGLSLVVITYFVSK
jgi:hypothetical protein